MHHASYHALFPMACVGVGVRRRASCNRGFVTKVVRTGIIEEVLVAESFPKVEVVVDTEHRKRIFYISVTFVLRDTRLAMYSMLGTMAISFTTMVLLPPSTSPDHSMITSGINLLGNTNHTVVDCTKVHLILVISMNLGFGCTGIMRQAIYCEPHTLISLNAIVAVSWLAAPLLNDRERPSCCHCS